MPIYYIKVFNPKCKFINPSIPDLKYYNSKTYKYLNCSKQLATKFMATKLKERFFICFSLTNKVLNNCSGNKIKEGLVYGYVMFTLYYN